MGTASWLVWHNGGWQQHSAALTMYVVQLALNLSWPPLFFSGHKLGLALADSTGQSSKAFKTVATEPYDHACMFAVQLIACNAPAALPVWALSVVVVQRVSSPPKVHADVCKS